MQTIKGHGLKHIQYITAFAEDIGSINAAIIFSRLEYWFKVMNGKPFYKFYEHCERHPLYREGDSWAEEILMKRRTFNSAFELIGNRFKTKSAFLAADDKFNGKMYASYYDRKRSQVYFIRNNDVVDARLEKLKSLETNSSPKKTNTQITRDKPDTGMLLYRSGNGIGCHSLVRENNLDKQINTSSPIKQNEQETSSGGLISEFDEIKVGKMIDMFIKKVWKTPGLVISKRIKIKALESLQSNFNDSLDEWEDYCLSISSSKFFMGETVTKSFRKPYFAWIIQAETISAIQSGNYGTGDRLQTLKKNIDDLKKHEQSIQMASKISREKNALNQFNQSSEEVKATIFSRYKTFLSQTKLDDFKRAKHDLSRQGDRYWQSKDSFGLEGVFFEWAFKKFLVLHFDEKNVTIEENTVNAELTCKIDSKLNLLKKEYAELSSFVKKTECIKETRHTPAINSFELDNKFNTPRPNRDSRTFNTPLHAIKNTYKTIVNEKKTPPFLESDCSDLASIKGMTGNQCNLMQ